MRKFWKAFIIMLCLFATNTSAQNFYVGANFGFVDINLNSGKNANQSVNGQLGCFITTNQAIEIDYTYGIKKDYVYYNRIGANYKLEFPLHSDRQAAPYVKLGAAYKAFGFEGVEDKAELCDLKLGVGFSYYLPSNKISVNVGLDFTNGFSDDVDFKWKNTQLQVNMGLAYHF